jgi:hypothetical protein
VTKSLFRALVTRVRTDWTSRYPWVRPVGATYVPAMPKASTFYVGAANRFARHLFLHFQHNSKPWAVGDVTINAIFSSRFGAPERWLGVDLEPDPEGSHRLGTIVHGNDKWWSLAPNDNRYGIVWRPSSYDDMRQVLSEAVDDISADVAKLFVIIGERGGLTSGCS